MLAAQFPSILGSEDRIPTNRSRQTVRDSGIGRTFGIKRIFRMGDGQAARQVGQR
jgi:hypothetical protein